MANVHIITAAIGSAVAWAAAVQLGWVAGLVVMFLFLLIPAACNHLVYSGGFLESFFGMIQDVMFFGVAIPYTIATFIRMIGIKKSIWTSILYMLSFGIVGIRLFQIPELWWFSIVAAVMFIYSNH